MIKVVSYNSLQIINIILVFSFEQKLFPDFYLDSLAIESCILKSNGGITVYICFFYSLNILHVGVTKVNKFHVLEVANTLLNNIVIYF